MALAGRTLNILGRSATRVRSTGVLRLRSEFAEGAGNVRFFFISRFLIFCFKNEKQIPVS